MMALHILRKRCRNALILKLWRYTCFGKHNQTALTLLCANLHMNNEDG